MTLPSTMRAVEVTKAGPAEGMQIKIVEMPKPGPQAVLIKVSAAGINRPDILQRKGLYPHPKGSSPILGLEISGTIVSVGSEVDSSVINQKVCALVPGGGYAEYCVTPYVQCLPIPKGITEIEAASLPETYFTVWSNVFDRGKLQPGETFLVQGGTSGIGVTAIQLVHAMGGVVFATAGSEEKVKACMDLGAKKAIDYKKEDFLEVFKSETDGKGVDVILDMVGGDYVAKEMSLLAEDGRLVFIGAMGGASATIGLKDFITKRIVLTGSSLRPRSVCIKGDIAKSLKEKVWPLIESGKIKPIIYKTFPLEQVVEAHRLMESSEHIGKIVLVIKYS